MLGGVCALAAALGVVGANAGAARAGVTAAGPAVSGPVVVVGISGLRWTDVSAAATPALWRVTSDGSPGSLVDYAILPHTCPEDAWLTMNAGNRARAPHTEKGPCPVLPAVTADPSGATASPAGTTPAQIAAMPGLTRFNQQFHTSPQWGLLASAAGRGSCSVAVGPGAALALASSSGQVSGYRPALPAAAGARRQLLARCPLTVVDLGSLPGPDGARRTAAVRHADTELAAITAALPAGTTLMVTAPGAATNPPHLQVVAVSGPGYRTGLLDAESTRQPGMVVLTDLTPPCWAGVASRSPRTWWGRRSPGPAGAPPPPPCAA